MRRWLLALVFVCLGGAAQAQIFSTPPYQLQNGTTADASQVMANFNQLVSNGNANSAKNGTNSDITSLGGLGAGSVTVPAVHFSGAIGTGLYLDGSGNACMATVGAKAWCISASQAITFTGNVTVPSLTVGGTVSASVPTGAIMAFNLATCPTGWQAADGTNSTVDARGVALRGQDNGAGKNPDGTVAIGTYQADAMQAFHVSTTVAGNSPAPYSCCGASGNVVGASSTALNSGGPLVAGGGAANTAVETRMRNVTVLYCEKL